MKSIVWGGVDRPVIATHGMHATWERNGLYDYTAGYAMDGDSHPGVDVTMPIGTPIQAIRGGRIETIRNIDQPGAMEVRVLDDLGHLHLYTHLSKRDVQVGDVVAAGERIGWSGESASPHLHFEHRIPDASTPMKWRIIDPTSLLISGGTPVSTPTVYDLRNNADAERFGYTPAQRDRFMQNCFRNRSGARPRAIFIHVQEGKTTSSLDWAIGGGNNSWTVTAQLDGSILRCMPEEHGPWTNGAVRNPKATAQKLLALGGNPNIWTLSIESEGYWNKPYTDAQIQAIYWQVRQWQEKYDIPDDWVFEHADVDSVQRANCAGPRYDAVRALMASSKPPVPTPDYPSAVPIAVLTEASEASGFAPATVYDPSSTVTFVWVGDRVRASRNTPRFRYATVASAKIGPDINQGEEFDVDYIFRAADGEFWYYTRFGTRVLAKDTIRISDAKAA